MILSLDQTVGETVAQDYRAASVFRTNGIDFCCKGGRSIRQACAEKGIAPETLLAQLQTALTAAPSAEPDYRAWPLDLLADYVVKKTPPLCTGKIARTPAIPRQTLQGARRTPS